MTKIIYSGKKDILKANLPKIQKNNNKKNHD